MKFGLTVLVLAFFTSSYAIAMGDQGSVTVSSPDPTPAVCEDCMCDTETYPNIPDIDPSELPDESGTSEETVAQTDADNGLDSPSDPPVVPDPAKKLIAHTGSNMVKPQPLKRGAKEWACKVKASLMDTNGDFFHYAVAVDVWACTEAEAKAAAHKQAIASPVPAKTPDDTAVKSRAFVVPANAPTTCVAK